MVNFPTHRNRAIRTCYSVPTRALVACLLLVALSGRAETDPLPHLPFEDLLDVVAIGTQMKTEGQLKHYPKMRMLYQDAGNSLRRSMQRGEFEPEQVFGNLQSALGHHSGRDFAMVLRDIWGLMELYQRFYDVNTELVRAGHLKPFEAFLTAICTGLFQRASGRPLVAADSGGKPNPIYYLRESDLLVQR